MLIICWFNGDFHTIGSFRSTQKEEKLVFIKQLQQVNRELQQLIKKAATKPAILVQMMCTHTDRSSSMSFA